MRIEKLVEGFKVIFLLAGILIFTPLPRLSHAAEVHFSLGKDSQARIRPFKAIGVPLAKFVQEYSRLTSTPITWGEGWDQLKGSVTLFLRHSLKEEEFKEIFYRVMSDNGFALIDSPAGNGWIIEKQRDARDAPLPVYAAAEVPDSARLVTAYFDLKFANADSIARTVRSFMPIYSRIIPAGESQLFITDVASNIRKLNAVLARMDTPEAAKIQRESSSSYSPVRSCGERKIENLTVEKLEIRDSGGFGQNFSIPGNRISGGSKK